MKKKREVRRSVAKERKRESKYKKEQNDYIKKDKRKMIFEMIIFLLFLFKRQLHLRRSVQVVHVS